MINSIIISSRGMEEGEASQARPVLTAMELSSADRQCTSGLAEMVRLMGGLGATSGNCWHPQVLGMLLLMVVQQ